MEQKNSHPCFSSAHLVASFDAVVPFLQAASITATAAASAIAFAIAT